MNTTRPDVEYVAVVDEAHLAHAEPETVSGPSSLRQRLGISSLDALVAATALLLCVALAPSLVFAFWSWRVAAMFPLAVLGVGVLIARLRERDITSTLLAATMLWCLVSALFSGHLRIVMLGTAGRDLSVLTVLLAVGVLSASRGVSARGREVVTGVVLAALGLGATLGILQVITQVDTGPLALAGGRPDGFSTNPVYFGALMAAGMATAGSWMARRSESSPLLAVATLVFGVATSLSGSRVALAAGVLALGLIVFNQRARALGPAGSAVAGLVVGVGLDRWLGAGRNAAARLSDTSGGGRSTVWSYAVEAWTERPLVGWGLGRFRSAVQGRFSPEFVREHATDELTQAWFDPHNVLLNVLVATGIVGVVLFGAVAIAIGLRCRGPLAIGIVPILLSWLLQPVGIVTLSVVALMAGVAMSDVTPMARPLTVASKRALVIIGLVFGCLVLVADAGLQRAIDDVDGPSAAQVATLWLDDPVVDDLVAQVYRFDVDAPDAREERLLWQTRAAESESDRPYWWSQLALRQLETGDRAGAVESLKRAYELQPYNVRTVEAEILMLIQDGDEAALAAALDRACELTPSRCDLDAAQLIEEFRTAVTAPDT